MTGRSTWGWLGRSSSTTHYGLCRQLAALAWLRASLSLPLLSLSLSRALSLVLFLLILLLLLLLLLLVVVVLLLLQLLLNCCRRRRNPTRADTPSSAVRTPPLQYRRESGVGKGAKGVVQLLCCTAAPARTSALFHRPGLSGSLLYAALRVSSLYTITLTGDRRHPLARARLPCRHRAPAPLCMSAARSLSVSLSFSASLSLSLSLSPSLSPNTSCNPRLQPPIGATGGATC